MLLLNHDTLAVVLRPKISIRLVGLTACAGVAEGLKLFGEPGFRECPIMPIAPHR